MKTNAFFQFLIITLTLVFACAYSTEAEPGNDAGLLNIESKSYGAEPDANRVDGDVLSISLVEKTDAFSQWDVTYLSDGLHVTGKLFTPKKAVADPPRIKPPGIVFNHGGIGGVPGPTVKRCRELASLGYVVIAPSYRGEGGSEGEIEVAAGEVDDALNAALALRSMGEADPERIAIMGTSHGGIITLLAIERDKDFAAAVCAYGVTNTFTWYKYLVDNGFDVSDPLSLKVYGKGPDDKPEAFRARAPALDARLISTPLLLLYGRKDTIVPPSQAEELAAALDKHKIPYVLHVYEDLGHGLLFFTDPKRRSEKEIEGTAKAWRATLDFLKLHLALDEALE